MLTRMTNFASRLQISSSFNFSRNIAAGFAGSFFALGGIFGLPLNKFIYGTGPAITAFIGSFIAFVARMKNNYDATDPDSLSPLFHKSENLLSTKMIMELLQKDVECSNSFLQNFKMDAAEIQRIKNWTPAGNDNLEDIWLHLYNELQPGFEKYLEKYTVSLTSAIMLGACHYMELMLLKVYSPELFSYKNDGSLIDIPIYLMAFTALLNGIIEFCNVKDTYEYPGKAKLCDGIFHAYQSWETSHPRPGDELQTVVLGNSKN